MSDVPLRWLGRADIVRLGGADIAAAIADVRAVTALLRAGDAEMPAELSLPLDAGRVYALPARVGGAYGAVGVKWAAHRTGHADGAPAILSVTLLNDAASGRPLGLVESGLLTAMRTAAVSALVLQHAASAPLRSIALLGAGMQASTHLSMLATLFPQLESVALWNRSAGRAEAMLAAIAPPFPCRIHADPADALAEGDAVLACTDAASPILAAETVRPGRIVLQVGRDEAPFAAIARADAVLVDLWGAFALTSAKSLFQMHRAGRFPAERVAADLPALLLDGWRPEPGSAVYFSSFGLNVFDIALAARVLRRAAEESAGTMIAMAGQHGAWSAEP